MLKLGDEHYVTVQQKNVFQLTMNRKHCSGLFCYYIPPVCTSGGMTSFNAAASASIDIKCLDVYAIGVKNIS